MQRVLTSEKLCVYKEETLLGVWALWCGGMWADLAKCLGRSCEHNTKEVTVGYQVMRASSHIRGL